MANSKRATRTSKPTTPSKKIDEFLSSTPQSAPSSKKRKLEEEDNPNPEKEHSASKSPSSSSSSSTKKFKSQESEKRLKPYRPKAPQTFLQKLERAQSQRMVVLNRSRSGQGADLKEDIDIVGSTGNIYTVTIARLPSCTCPDHGKGHECKHKVYALNTVLRAPHELQYQRAFLTDEIQEILANAPPIPTADGDSEDGGGKRKPVEGECPICYMDYDEARSELVWCRAGCGNNMHRECFEQWAASQRGQEVRCVYCRAPWQRDDSDLQQIKSTGEVTEEGYVNVADQFGISRVRDTSGYYQPWARREFGYGG